MTEPRKTSMMPLPALNDAEGDRVPADLPPIVDAHLHLFPDRVFDAIWRWFGTYGWPIRYQIYTDQILDFLASRGVERVVALHYAHKPGMARALNEYMAEVCRRHAMVTGLATVLPGEEGAVQILEDAFAAGLRGVKLHCHVQCMAPDDPRIAPLYELCAREDKPLVIHAGREPASEAYGCDVRSMCGAAGVENVLRDFPRLRLCIPHLGADEFGEYASLLERYDNLWLDTTVALAEYLPLPTPRFFVNRPERILYGSDFPNLPYAWDRELVRLRNFGLSEEGLELVCGKTAEELYGVPKLQPRHSRPAE